MNSSCENNMSGQQAATSFGSNWNSTATLRKKQLIAATRKGVGGGGTTHGPRRDV